MAKISEQSHETNMTARARLQHKLNVLKAQEEDPDNASQEVIEKGPDGLILAHNIDARNGDFRGFVQISKFDCTGGDFHGAKFDRASLDAVLDLARTGKICLHGIDLSGRKDLARQLMKSKEFVVGVSVNCTNVDLTDVDLSGSDLKYVNLTNANLSGVNAAGAKLDHAILKNTTAQADKPANFEGAQGLTVENLMKAKPELLLHGKFSQDETTRAIVKTAAKIAKKGYVELNTEQSPVWKMLCGWLGDHDVKTVNRPTAANNGAKIDLIAKKPEAIIAQLGIAREQSDMVATSLNDTKASHIQLVEMNSTQRQ